MGRLAAIIVAGTTSPWRRAALFLVIFVLLAAGAVWVASEQVAQSVRVELGRSIVAYSGMRSNIVALFDQMDARLSGAPCSPDYIEEMRRIAFTPDGINELLYAPGGKMSCSVNSGALVPPVDLGVPDIAASDAFGISLWLDHDLAFLHLDGLTGTIARRGDFALVVPPQYAPAEAQSWMAQELVFHTATDHWLHRTGMDGLYASARAAPPPALAAFTGAIHQLSCDPAGEHCVAGRADILPILARNWPAVLTVLGVIGVLAAWLTQQSCERIRRHWSFEQRFLRQFEHGSILCAYQPVLDLRSDRITACEVLARWRDLDGAIVPPDQFLPIVERHGLTERFTDMVVAQAHADLSLGLPDHVRLQVNFNIFPQDLRAERLVALFAPFLTPDSRFNPVVELVETAEIEPETAQVEIERLRAAGISTYIDDFGAGYSSMRSLAALSIDGVKLDRSFAMAPEDSVMARMLEHAIELVQATGRRLVVEGVETRERLDLLRRSGNVDYAQGYVIARPLLIEGFAAFLAEQELARPSPSRHVA